LGRWSPNLATPHQRVFGLALSNPAADTFALFMSTTPNLRTQAEFYIKGLTQGFVTAAEVIAWADEVIVAAEKTEEWMIDISTCGEDARMDVLHHLHAVKGEVDEAALATMLAARQ